MIRIDECQPATFERQGDDYPVSLIPLTGEDCDLCALIFTLPPNHVGIRHSHPADTVYVVRKGEFIVEGEGTYGVGDIRWVKAGTPYGPEIGGPQGCEVMLIAAGTFPLPTFPADDQGRAAGRPPASAAIP